MKLHLKKEYGNLIPYSNEDAEKLAKFQDGATYEVDIKNYDIRTLKQNRLIHQFCKNISIEAKKQNFKLKQLVKDGTELSMESVKELMFKPIAMSLYGKSSTTKLNRDEVSVVIETVLSGLSHYGLNVENILKEH